MFKNDNIRPLRITDAVRNMWQRVLHSERGEAGDGGDGGDGDAAAAAAAAAAAKNSGDWRSTLDETVRNHPSLKDFKSPNDVVKSYVEVQKLIGPEKIIMPGKDADEKEWNERVFDRLGRPKDPKEYALPTDLQIPKELPISEKLVDGFRGIAHKTGMLPKQFQEAYKWFMNEQITAYNDAVTANKKVADESRTALRTEWGAAFDQNLALGEKVLQTYGNPDIIKEITDKGLNTSSNFVKFLHNVGKNFSEDQLTGKPPSLTMSPDEAKEEIRKMESDVSDKNPLFNAQHHEHEAIKKKRDMLYRLAYPNG